jgi:Na+/H+ antiporter NhaD/arsenite permease-like protein
MMRAMQGLILAVFAVVYLGMALGRWPGLKLDRTGVALVGAIVLFAASGFYDWNAARIAAAPLSTLAGNLLLVGSLANIIVAERAAAAGVRFGFADDARAGVPMTLASMALAVAWLALLR